MADLSREEILKRIAIEDTRIASADHNIAGLITQKNKSLDEQARLFALLDALPEAVPVEEETGDLLP